MNDNDAQETQEWLEALDSVMDKAHQHPFMDQ